MTSDPMTIPMIFLRLGWMNRYQGQTASDKITGGGSFVEAHGYGHEIFNFQQFDGRVYGYVQAPGAAYNGEGGTRINIDRLGASPKDESMSGVIAVWVATASQGGMFIVGWYQNATIHRRWQVSPPESNRRHDGNEFGYYVTAASSNAVLLPPDERIFPVPRGKDGMGQANIWYADSADPHRNFRSELLSYITTRQSTQPVVGSNGGLPRQCDPVLKQKVEQAAIEKATAYYTSLGYEIDSVEGDNVGWDLNAVHVPRQLALKLEVKGLSGSECKIELTPNEYSKLQQHRESYRICVVTQALTSPELSIFAHSQDSQQWEDQRGQVLDLEEIVAVRCRAVLPSQTRNG